MISTFKFFKHRNGISAFAEISINAIVSSQFSVTWTEACAQYERIYGTAVHDGIADAMRWHRETGGSRFKFVVIEFTELAVDTKSDAVRCASTAAAWKALGHSEAEFSFEFDHGWRVVIHTQN